MKKSKFAISVFTENKPGLLNRVTGIVNRRKVNIDSISASESEMEGIYRYTIFLTEEETLVQKIVKQIEKQVDIYKAFYHSEEEIISKELALFKIDISIFDDVAKLVDIIKKYSARIAYTDKKYIVIEMIGDEKEIQTLYTECKPFGLLEYVKSGSIAVTKPMKLLSEFI